MYQKINSETIERAKRVNERGIGVAPPLNLFYYYSILYSAECAFRAFEFYESLLIHKKNIDATQLVGAIQEAIGHAGALAFYFWNNGNSKMKDEIKEYTKNRSAGLRNDFNLSDDSPLKDRNLRNTFEHFDEKVDIFLINNLAGTFFPMPIIGKHTDLEEEQLNKNFKLLDIQAKCLVLLNHKFFFEDIQNEVIEIYKTAQNMIKQHG